MTIVVALSVTIKFLSLNFLLYFAVFEAEYFILKHKTKHIYITLNYYISHFKGQRLLL